MSFRTRSSLGAALLVAAASLPSTASAQTLVPDAPSCPRCTIETTDLVLLEDSAPAFIPGWPSEVVQDGRGRYWLVFINDLPLVYGPDGRFLQELGPRGEGPGEWGYPVAVTPLPGDSVLVFDRSRQAFYVLAPDLAIARALVPEQRFGAVSAVVARWPDEVLLNAPQPLRPGSLDPYAVTDLRGATLGVLRTFGTDPSAPAPAGRVNLYRRLAPAGTGAVWTWRGSPYVLERWTREGERTAALERRPSWFLTERAPGATGPQPPLSSVLDAQQDAAGRVWVFTSVAAPDWREGLDTGGGGGSVRDVSPTATANEKLYRTTVEVIDPEAGRVVARAALEHWVAAVLPGLRAAIYDTTPAGIPFVRIVQLALVE